MSSGSMNQQPLLSKAPMHTIDEVESPSKATEIEPEFPMVTANLLEMNDQHHADEIPIVPIDETDLNESIMEEDELLNQKYFFPFVSSFLPKCAASDLNAHFHSEQL